MLKKAGIVVAAAAAGLLAIAPLASASILSIDDNDIQIPVQACGNDIASGVLGILSFGDQENESSDKTDCKQKNSASHKNENNSDDED